MSENPTWEGLGQGMLVLAVVWWAWGGYAWMTNALHRDDWLARLGLFSAMGAMLIAALAVPQAFGDDAVVFGLAYFAVRAIHIAVYAYGAAGGRRLRRDPQPRARAAGRPGADRLRRLPRRRRTGGPLDRRAADRLRHAVRPRRQRVPGLGVPLRRALRADHHHRARRVDRRDRRRARGRRAHRRVIVARGSGRDRARDRPVVDLLRRRRDHRRAQARRGRGDRAEPARPRLVGGPARAADRRASSSARSGSRRRSATSTSR